MINRRRLVTLASSGCALPVWRTAQAKSRRLRLAFGSGLDNPFGVACRTIAEEVGKRTDGRLTIDIYPNATLGNDETTLAATQAGALDLTAVSSALLASYAPEIGLLDLPFLFQNRAHAQAALDGPEGRDLARISEAQRLPVLAWGENGVRHLTGHRPMRDARDVQGLKLRVLPAPLLLNAFKAMGALAEAIPFSQLYEALLTGRFEAQENPLQLIHSARLYDVQSHVTLTAHTYSAMAIVVSADLLEDLDKPDQDILADAARLAAIRSREFVGVTDAKITDSLREKGMTIITDPDRESFRRAAAPAEADAAARLGADRIARLRAV